MTFDNSDGKATVHLIMEYTSYIMVQFSKPTDH